MSTGQEEEELSNQEVANWDLSKLIETVNKSSIRVPDDIKGFDDFKVWLNSIDEDDFVKGVVE